MLFWWLFTIATGVMALGLFGSVMGFTLFWAVIRHWVVMLVWMVMQQTEYCILVDNRSGMEHKSSLLEFGFRIVAAFIHIFCFFKLYIEGHTRLRCATYYIIVYSVELDDSQQLVHHSSAAYCAAGFLDRYIFPTYLITSHAYTATLHVVVRTVPAARRSQKTCTHMCTVVSSQ